MFPFQPVPSKLPTTFVLLEGGPITWFIISKNDSSKMKSFLERFVEFDSKYKWIWLTSSSCRQLAKSSGSCRVQRQSGGFIVDPFRLASSKIDVFKVCDIIIQIFTCIMILKSHRKPSSPARQCVSQQTAGTWPTAMVISWVQSFITPQERIWLHFFLRYEART